MSQYKFNLSIVAIFKNEALYLKDWIEFHIKVGVEHFYLYNNNSTDNYKEVLEPFKNFIDLYEWPLFPGQRQAYEDCILNKADTKWLAVIDLDEYIVPINKDNLSEVLSDYDKPDISALCIYWVVFGSDGKEKYEPTPVPLRFQYKILKETSTVKSIVRPERVVPLPENPHVFLPKVKSGSGFFSKILAHKKIFFRNVNEDFETLKGHPRSANMKTNIVQINHYFTKSREEWVIRCNRKTATTKNEKSPEQFDVINSLKKAKDTTILRFYN